MIERIIFPSMLRKMWSGGEVQEWLDAEVARRIAAAPQPVQEPVGEMRLSELVDGLVIPVVPADLPIGTKLYAAPQPVQDAADQAHELALKVRAALDRTSCPDAWMRIAYDPVVANFVAPHRAQGKKP